jgi:hypothetical protein
MCPELTLGAFPALIAGSRLKSKRQSIKLVSVILQGVERRAPILILTECGRDRSCFLRKDVSARQLRMGG